jgi:hypothetical protein
MPGVHDCAVLGIPDEEFGESLCAYIEPQLDAIIDAQLSRRHDRKNARRQNSDIAHELAHILLEHEPGKMVLSQDGSIVMRSFDPKQEEEANCLGWNLLLPRTALAHATKARLGPTEIARKWVVSEQLVEYRTRITGIRRQFGR